LFFIEFLGSWRFSTSGQADTLSCALSQEIEKNKKQKKTPADSVAKLQIN